MYNIETGIHRADVTNISVQYCRTSNHNNYGPHCERGSSSHSNGVQEQSTHANESKQSKGQQLTDECFNAFLQLLLLSKRLQLPKSVIKDAEIKFQVTILQYRAKMQ